MGSNSTDSLHAFLEEFISRCVVVGDKILTPDQQEKARKEYDPTSGGHRLPKRGTIDRCLVCNELYAHGGLPCPRMQAIAQSHGRPDLKRGQ